MDIFLIKEFLQDHHGIKALNIKPSDQGQTHEGYFIDSDYFLKVYKKKDQHENALQQSKYGAKIIAHGIIDNVPYILFDQIYGITVAEVLPSLNIVDQHKVLVIITQILKQIHQEEKREDGSHRVHGDYHIGNIMIDGDRSDIKSYKLIDWDNSRIGTFENEYGAILESIIIPNAIVSEKLEKYYDEKQLLNWWSVFQEVYPEFITGRERAIKKVGTARAEQKFAFKNGANARANAMGNKIIDFINQV